MDLGLCTISNKERSVEAVMDVATDLGADGVEVWGRDHVGDGGPEACARIADAAAARDLAVPVYGSYLRPGTDGFADALEREVRAAADLGAGLIRVWAGDREWAESDEAYRERVGADLARLANAAADRGVGVTVERHSGTLTDTTAGARAVVEAAPAGVGLNWQPQFRQDAAAVARDVRELAPLANNVHLQAVLAPGGSERCALADAYYDVAGAVDALDDAGYDGYLEVEFVTERAPYRPAAAADLAFLRALRG